MKFDVQATVMYVTYDYFYQKERFFLSFVKDSDYYNTDNDANFPAGDMNIFEGMDLEADPLPYKDEDILVICGTRWCGCRWNLMYDHGFRNHYWYDNNVNDFVLENLADSN